MYEYDFVIIGSGPGGYVAAIRAAQMGCSVLLIEKEENLGGTCLNWGCIPTKSLLKTAEMVYNIKRARSFGIKVCDIEVMFSEVIERSRKVVATLSKGVSYLMNKNNIKVYYGIAKLLGNSTVEVTLNKGERVNVIGKSIIIATGAKSRELTGVSFSDVVWSARNAMMPNKLPKSLLIVGTGAIGIEFASFYHNLGSKVTMVEMKDVIMPLEDHEISEYAQRIFAEQGIDIYTSSSISKVDLLEDNVRVDINKEKEVINLGEFDRMIVAIGIIPNTNDLGIENTKIKIDSGFISTNEYYLTNEPNVYAIGDVAGPPCLAHKASFEAVLCVEKVLGRNNVSPLERNNIPSCIYSIPQIASVGITEIEAQNRGFNVRIGKSYAISNGKALAQDDTEGFIKLVIDDETGELLGAHMIGMEVTEMISSCTIGKNIEVTDVSIKDTIFPHPTLSEMIHEAVLCASNESLNS